MNNCRLCRSAELKFLYSIRDFPIVKCRNCGLVQLATQPTEEEMRIVYNDTYFKHDKYADPLTLYRENHRRLNLVQKYMGNKNKKILDAGCGVGDFINLAKASFDMHGFDLSRFAVQLAQVSNPEIAQQIWSGRVENLDIQPNSFDAVCLWDVLEHIWDFMPACQKFLEILKPGGTLFISMPHIHSIHSRVMGKYWVMMTPPEHVNFFNRKSAAWLFENILAQRVIEWRSKGKWANLGFMVYKLNRIFPDRSFDKTMSILKSSYLSRLAIYVPLGDIQYIVVRKQS